MIIAYASSNSNPLSTLEDSTINLNTGGTLPQNVNFYGAGTDSEDNSPNFTFSWTVLKKPDSSTSSLSDSALQNPVLNNVDVFGNYRLFLIVTNTNTGNTSETDPVLAPNSAFTHVRVKSLELALQKPASGERNWSSLAYEWVDALENHESRIDDLEVIGLDDLSDVTLSTLSSGQVLKYNGTNWINDTDNAGGGTLDIQDQNNTQNTSVNLLNEDLMFKSTDSNLVYTMGTDSLDNTKKFVEISLASDITVSGVVNIEGASLNLNSDNTAGDTLIKFNRGDSEIPTISYDQSASTFKLKRNNAGGSEVIMTQDDVPTTTVRGGVLLLGSLNSTGKILDFERLIYTASADQSVEGKLTGQASEHPTIRVLDGTGGLGTSASNHAHILFRNNTGADLNLKNLSLVLIDSGTFTTNDYTFQVVTYSSPANMATNTINTTDNLGTITRTTGSKTGYIETTVGRTVPHDHYFGVKCTQECDGHLGHGLRVTIEARRDIVV